MTRYIIRRRTDGLFKARRGWVTDPQKARIYTTKQHCMTSCAVYVPWGFGDRKERSKERGRLFHLTYRIVTLQFDPLLLEDAHG